MLPHVGSKDHVYYPLFNVFEDFSREIAEDVLVVSLEKLECSRYVVVLTDTVVVISHSPLVLCLNEKRIVVSKMLQIMH